MTEPTRLRKFLRHGVIIATFALIAVLALYWNLAHADTQVGGTWTTDYYHFHWNYWWIRHALTNSLNVYETGYVLAPFTTNLAFHTLTPFWYPLWAAFEPLIGTLAAMHVIMLIALTLTGYTFFILLQCEDVPAALALPFGMFLEVSSGMMLSVMLQNVNYIAVFWLPVNLLIWGNVARASTPRRRWMWTFVQGVVFYATLMTDYSYGLFLAFLLIPYGLWTLIRAEPPARRQLIGCGIVAIGLCATLLYAVGPLPSLLSADRSGFAPQPLDDAPGIPFPEGYIARYGLAERLITLGSLLLPAALLSLIVGFQVKSDRRRWFWLVVAILPLLLSVGASVQIAGITIPMPFTTLYTLFGSMFRVPSRFDSVVIIALLLFVGVTWGQTVRRIRQRIWIAPMLILLVAFDSHLFRFMPIQPVLPAYTAYEQMGEEDHALDYVVLEIPVTGGSGEAWVGAGDTGQPWFDAFRPMQTQFYGVTHEKRMLNGALARAPLEHFWYWLYDDPMLAWLGQRRQLEPETVEAQLRERIFTYPIGYLVLHQDLIGRSSPINEEIIGFFNQLHDLLCPPMVEGDAVFYRTAWHPSGCDPRTPPENTRRLYTIDIGSSGDERYILEGWHPQETIFDTSIRWMGYGDQAALILDLPPDIRTVEFTAQAFHEPRLVTVRLEHVELGTLTIQPDALSVYRMSIPQSFIGGENIRMNFAYDDAISAADVELGADQRPLSIMIDTLHFFVAE